MDDIAHLLQRAIEFVATLEKAKKQIAPRDFEWYPFNSLANLLTLEKLLTGDARRLLDLAGGKPILDVGCADGDLAFFFESLGCAAQAIDNPVTNFNAMRGLRALKAQLGSAVEIWSMDLDSQFALPDQQYGLVLLLGILYHLKNPFHVLEKLSRQARYCLISTAITEFVPGLYDSVTGTSVAYLADVYELNDDSTNYWILSDAGFRRLLGRANWEICDYLLTADQLRSGGASRVAGRRAFCLARSRFIDRQVKVLYGKGWHDVEEGGWRWTKKEFSVRLESSREAGARLVRMKLFVPEALIDLFQAVRLRAAANGVDLAEECYDRAGQYEYTRRLPFSTVDGDVRIDFWLDHALPPDEQDRRERGIVVASLEGLPLQL